MPVAKIHALEGQYSEARLDKVSNAIQEALVGCDMPDAIFTHPLLAEDLNTLFAMFDG